MRDQLVLKAHDTSQYVGIDQETQSHTKIPTQNLLKSNKKKVSYQKVNPARRHIIGFKFMCWCSEEYSEVQKDCFCSLSFDFFCSFSKLKRMRKKKKGKSY